MSSWEDTPIIIGGGWESRFGGIAWRYDSTGIYIRDSSGNESGPQRTPGDPTTCTAIVNQLGTHIINRSIEFGIAPELIIMTIATEASQYRNIGFTGPETFRWEPHVKVKDDPPEFSGDYSLGPMQTLATTARWVIRAQNLSYEPLTEFPALRVQPNIPPADLPGYNVDLNIHIGTAEIYQRWSRTDENPILVSAAFNAGGIYDASNPNSRLHNRWHIRTYGNHLDRASKWFGDACFVLAGLRG